jgi:hypothetical protein
MLFFAGCALGVAAFVEYQRAVASAANIPTKIHTISVIQDGRTVYVSEAQWRRVHLLELASGGFAILGLFVAICFLMPALLARLVRTRGIKTLF